MSKIFKTIITVLLVLTLIAFVLLLIDWIVKYFLSCILMAISFAISIP